MNQTSQLYKKPGLQTNELLQTHPNHIKNLAHFEISALRWQMENYCLPEKELGRLNSYEIIWIKKGAGILTVDLEDYEIEDGLVYFLTPGQWRNLQLHTGIDGYYISLSVEFFYLTETNTNASLFPTEYEREKIPLIWRMDKDMLMELEEILIRMKKEYDNYFLLRSEVLRSLFKIFILYMSRKFVIKERQGVNNRDTDLANRFMGLLKKHFTTKKMVADYAGELCVTPSYLNQVVKKVSGFAASHHIQQLIVLEAKRQAMYSKSNMKEIAYALGFTDIAHFSKFFKNNSGVNFSNFKKQHVNQVAVASKYGAMVQ